MHASSLENMRECHRRFVAGGPLEARAETVVLDIGAADVNGSYRALFDRPPYRYVGADMAAGPGVDLVLADPYRIPMADGSVDIVLSGQALEHCEFFWLAFAEMVRVLSREGFIFLIAPSAGAIHRFPVDCYRFHPDAYAALAKLAGCTLVACWHDERGPWRDLVGVFRRADAGPLPALAPAPFVPGWSGSAGSAAEEATAGSGSYLDVLARLHATLAPSAYLEIGVRHGASLSLARGPAMGIDPAPALDRPLPPDTHLLAMTSDAFFAAGAAGIVPDLAFIDGMHLFEHALRDFMNVERRAAPGAVVVLDDILPNHPAQAARARRTRVWTGDVWRLAEVLRRHRPDLFLLPIDTAPAGLLLVAGLDPGNRVLWDGYNPIVAQALAEPGPPPAALRRDGAVDPDGEVFARVLAGLAAARAAGCGPAETTARLRGALAEGAPRLSVIVIAHDMARELPRTIRSLSPAMQRGIDPAEYEVIVVDNGSAEPVDAAALRALLPGVTVHRMANATVSPVPAINFALARAQGGLVGVCIDGARMVSPGLLARALAASRLHPRPVIGTLSWHLGPAPQQESMRQGYDQAAEDALLAGAGWEADGYRLFDIACLAPSSAGGWFELPAESNAVFLRAEHWRELALWDEGFRAPGGGMANLDAWKRACTDPSMEVIMLLGEATFHQIHGGVATNALETPIMGFHAEYIRLRGGAYTPPSRRPLLFGALPNRDMTDP